MGKSGKRREQGTPRSTRGIVDRGFPSFGGEIDSKYTTFLARYIPFYVCLLSESERGNSIKWEPRKWGPNFMLYTNTVLRKLSESGNVDRDEFR